VRLEVPRCALRSRSGRFLALQRALRLRSARSDGAGGPLSAAAATVR